MKTFSKILMFSLLAGGMTILSYGQDRTELCPGSGTHCMDVDYGGVKAAFVKAKNQPGVIIIEGIKTS